MNVRSFPHSGSSTSLRHHAVRIDELLALTNSRLFLITGNPDVIATRLGLRQLKRLGLAALVYGAHAEVVPAGGLPCANDEVRPAG
jgi:hypothetical protein